jgi:hypothetical protein
MPRSAAIKKPDRAIGTAGPHAPQRLPLTSNYECQFIACGNRRQVLAAIPELVSDRNILNHEKHGKLEPNART